MFSERDWDDLALVGEYSSTLKFPSSQLGQQLSDTYPFIMDCAYGSKSSCRHKTKETTSYIVICFSSDSSVLSLFLICHMGSFKWKCSLFKPFSRRDYLECIPSFYGWYFHLSCSTDANFSAKAFCVYITPSHPGLARI